ncbi:ABC transporter substrate-binding protein [Nakamurella lactea]|uniref:ABC transporter substrate-binding protein n=1 Tax=Nakamurella lactea TaxID=459515 RepID=UPI0004278CAE|nr:ABC transporter substrate-binding protein [Nakamurella lactea]
MKVGRKRFAGVVTALTIAALALAGCSNSDSSGSTDTGTTAAGSATSEGAGATTSNGGSDAQSAAPAGNALPDDQQNLTFVPAYGWAGSDISKNPLEIGVNMAISQVLDSLVKFDQDMKIVPGLATEWSWNTPTELVFKLRTGVTFSDGTPFTSADVKGSLERYIAAEGPLAAVLAPIEKIEAPDDATVKITTNAPTGTLVGVLSMVKIGKAEFSHTKSTAADDAYWAKPIGTGPFVITDYVANDHFSFARNDKYWGEKAKLKTLTMKQITDVNAKITALSNDQVQVLNDLTYDQFDTVKALPNVTLSQFDSLSYYFVWFENSRKPLDNPDVRRAMWMALDLPTIVSSLYGDSRQTMDSFCPSTAFGCLPAKDMPTYDPEGAKKLLADAGYPNGFSIDMIFSLANATDSALAQTLISSWKAIGVTVEPRGLDSATWLKEFQALNWYMDFQPNQTLTGDADYTLNRLYSCVAKRLGYCNPDLDKLMTKAQQSNDKAERLKLYQQVVDIMAKDVPAIPLFQTKVNVAYKNNVKGLVVPPTEYIDFSTVYLAS